MDYETMDWELEAERVKVAFGLEGDCEFTDVGEGRREFRFNNEERFPLHGTDLVVALVYSVTGTLWLANIGSEEFPNENNPTAWLNTLWNGTVRLAIFRNPDFAELNWGLSELGFLTPEVEVALELNVKKRRRKNSNGR